MPDEIKDGKVDSPKRPDMATPPKRPSPVGPIYDGDGHRGHFYDISYADAYMDYLEKRVGQAISELCPMCRAGMNLELNQGGWFHNERVRGEIEAMGFSWPYECRAAAIHGDIAVDPLKTGIGV